MIMKSILKGIYIILFAYILLLSVSEKSDAQFYIKKNYENHKIDGSKLIINTDGGLIEIEAWNDDIIRVSYDNDYKGNLELTQSVILPRANVGVQIQDFDSTLFYSTKNVTVKINKYPLLMEYYRDSTLFLKDTSGGFFYYEGYEYHGIKFALKNNEQLYGFGSQAVDINRRKFSIILSQVNRYGYEWPFKANLNFAIPFYMSSENYGVYFDHDNFSVVVTDKEQVNILNYFTIKTDFSFFLINGNNYADILNKYTNLTGKQPLPPRWALGYLQSRAYYFTEKETRDIVNSMRENDYPQDAIIFDGAWFGGQNEMGNLYWSRDRFPHYEQMINDFNEMGINTILHTVLYLSAPSDYYYHVKSYGLCCMDKYKNPVYCKFQGRDDFLVYDMTNPSTIKWFWGLYKKQMKLGIPGWWLDGGEPEIYPSEIVHFNGKTMRNYANFINFLWLKMLYEGYHKDFPDLRPFFMTRSGWAGAQRFGAFPLCGDEARSWKGLKAMIPVMLGASMSGLSYLHSDVGGFAPKDALMHNELYIRWFQLGAFSPIMRAHRALPVPAEPIFYDKYVQDIVRKYIYLRYTFLPYNYSIAYENTASGLPLMKPIDFYDAHNSLLHNINDEFFWGKDILVAPIVDSVFERDITFPQGDWIDWFTHEKFQGNKKYKINVPLEKLPLYVRSGSIIPTANHMYNTKNYKADSLTLHYFPDTAIVHSNFKMFNDDGKNYNSIDNNEYEFLNFFAENKNSEIFFTLTHNSPTHSYHSVEKRDIKICIHNIPFSPGTLLINDKNIKIVNTFTSTSPENDYAVYLKNRNELWIHLNWHNGSTVITINDVINSIINYESHEPVMVVEEFIPNPFTNETKLEYTINSSTDLQCLIYDLKGSLINKWKFSNWTPGKYYIIWNGKDNNGRDVSSGVYLFQLVVPRLKKTFIRVIYKLN